MVKARGSLAVAPSLAILNHRYLYVAVDQNASSVPRGKFRQAERQPTTARSDGLGGNGALCFMEIVPNLDSDETNQQGEKDAQCR